MTASGRGAGQTAAGAGVREADIIRLAAEFFDRPAGRIDRTDVLAAAGDNGKAASQFLTLYSMRFRVDMRPYKWWFHHRDNGVFAIPLVARDPEGNVIRVPLASADLARFAEAGRWDVDYPPHRLGLSSWWWAVLVFGICGLGLAYAFFLR